MRTIRGLAAICALLACCQANASATRTIDADALRSSDRSKTYTLPGATGTLLGSAGLVQEQPGGTVNGSNVTFTLANTPLANASVVLYLDGIVLTQGAGKDYTISGATITMAVAPANAQSLWATYSK